VGSEAIQGIGRWDTLLVLPDVDCAESRFTGSRSVNEFSRFAEPGRLNQA
jgi:hypothetical protein